MRQAEAGQAGLKESVEKLTADKTSADAKLREVDANLSVMRDRIARAEADAKTAKEQFETAEAARKQSAAFAAELAQRLRIAPNASSAEVIAALDQALRAADRRTDRGGPDAPECIDRADAGTVPKSRPHRYSGLPRRGLRRRRA